MVRIGGGGENIEVTRNLNSKKMCLSILSSITCRVFT
jgi:hypothetical protein